MRLRAIAPYLAPTVTAAAYCRTEGHANPRLVGPAYARAALQRGAVIRTNAPVVALDRRNGGWHVRIAGDEDVAVDAVLVAAGVWTGEVAAMADVRLPVVPVALSMIATEPVAQFVPHLVQHVGRRLSLKQAHDGNVLVGGGWASRLVHHHGVVELDARPELRFDSLAGNAWTAARVVPALADVAVLRAWSGVAPVTADQLPIVGAVPRRPGLFVAAGGPGFTLGAGALAPRRRDHARRSVLARPRGLRPAALRPPHRRVMRIEKGVTRPEAVTIDVDGEAMPAYPGESLAAALLAGGRRAFRVTEAASPAGPFCNMGVCFDCLVEVDGGGSARA